MVCPIVQQLGLYIAYNQARSARLLLPVAERYKQAKLCNMLKWVLGMFAQHLAK